jgi:protein TonB
MLQWLAIIGMASGSAQPASAPEYQQPEMYRPRIEIPHLPPPLKKVRPALPLGNPAMWVTTADYPAEALRNGEQGAVQFRLKISPEGLVTDCTILVSSGFPVLDATACDKIRSRARFSPALDSKGKPTEATYVNSVRWLIPKDMKPPQPINVTQSMIVDADGTVHDCKRGMSSKVQPIMTVQLVPCPVQKLSPYLDEAGKPVRRRITSNMSITVDPVD